MKKTLFAILAHENPEFLKFQIARLREFHPNDGIIVVATRRFLSGLPPSFDYLTAEATTRWGQLHRPLLVAMERAVAAGYDFMTVVDSDQMPLRSGWTEALDASGSHSFGWMGTRCKVYSSEKNNFHVVDDGRRILRGDYRLNTILMNEGWDGQTLIWGFNPGSTYSKNAMQWLVELDRRTELGLKIGATRLFAPEEVLFPTLIGLKFNITAAPGDHSLLSYKVNHTEIPLEVEDGHFWIHPVPRDLDHPVIHELYGHYPRFADRDITSLKLWERVRGVPGNLTYEAFLGLCELGELLHGVDTSFACQRAKEALSVIKESHSVPPDPTENTTVPIIVTFKDWADLVKITLSHPLSRRTIIITDYEVSKDRADLINWLSSSGQYSINFHGALAIAAYSDDPIVEKRHQFTR